MVLGQQQGGVVVTPVGLRESASVVVIPVKGAKVGCCLGVVLRGGVVEEVLVQLAGPVGGVLVARQLAIALVSP